LLHHLVWFDEEKGYERELRYATNQKSVFVDEQQGPCTLKHVVFENGTLTVPRNKTSLQKFLDIHPMKGFVFTEFDEIAEAVDDLDYLELEIEAMNAASNMEVDQAEAILRVEQGSNVSTMTSKQIKIAGQSNIPPAIPIDIRIGPTDKFQPVVSSILLILHLLFYPLVFSLIFGL